MNRCLISRAHLCPRSLTAGFTIGLWTPLAWTFLPPNLVTSLVGIVLPCPPPYLLPHFLLIYSFLFLQSGIYPHCSPKITPSEQFCDFFCLIYCLLLCFNFRFEGFFNLFFDVFNHPFLGIVFWFHWHLTVPVVHLLPLWRLPHLLGSLRLRHSLVHEFSP